MGMEGKRLKNCSTSTDVAVTADKKRLQKGKRKLDSLEKKKKKKKKIRKENKQSDVEVMKISENKQKEDDLELKNKLRKESHNHFQLFKARRMEMMKWVKRRICVFGFDTSLPHDDIKTALTNHFCSCGTITSVVVTTIGRYAHIDMMNPEEADQALTLHGSLLAGKRLEVRMATNPLSLYRSHATTFMHPCEIKALVEERERERERERGSINPSY